MAWEWLGLAGAELLCAGFCISGAAGVAGGADCIALELSTEAVVAVGAAGGCDESALIAPAAGASAGTGWLGCASLGMALGVVLSAVCSIEFASGPLAWVLLIRGT